VFSIKCYLVMPMRNNSN